MPGLGCPYGVILLLLASCQLIKGYPRSQSHRDPARPLSGHNDHPAPGTSTGPASSEDEDIPVFLSRQRFISVYKGAMAVLPCRVNHLGDRQVAWRRVETDEFLTIGRMVYSKDQRLVLEAEHLEDDVTSWKLPMRNVRYNDAGLYECQVTSSEHLTWEMRLVVLEPVSTSKPTPKPHRPATRSPHVQAAEHKFVSHIQEFVVAGLPIRLVCSTSLGNQSTPRSRLEWYKDGVLIQSTSRVLLTRYQFESNRTYVSQLLIDRSQVSDTGKYVCRMTSEDLLVAKIFVNARNSKNNPKREDRSQHYKNVDTLQAENATSRPRADMTTLTSLLLVLNILSRLTTLVAQDVIFKHGGYISKTYPT